MAADQPDVNSIAAGWLAILLISTVFIDKSTRVKTSVLPLLYQPGHASEFSWASSILACLYRGMGKGTRMFAATSDGATYLLQVFSSTPCYVCM